MSQVNTVNAAGFRIRVYRPSATTIEHPLEEGRSVFIGRGDSCGIQVKGNGVADIHCLIDVEEDIVSIQDWASNEGTKVNGKTIDDKTEIHSGDSIVLGSTKLELVGCPSGESAKARAAAENADKEPREESVGMETMGYETSDGDGTALAEPPVMQPAAERLSDAFEQPAAEAIDTEPIDVELECEEEAVETVAEIAEDLSETVTPVAEGSEDDQEDPALEDSSDQGFDEPSFGVDDFASNHLTAADLDWDPTTFDDDQVDAEIVQLLKSEIEDLRIQLAERDEQLTTLDELGPSDSFDSDSDSRASQDGGYAGSELVGRVDDLLAELAEHDERVATLQELLQTAEIQNQAEQEERNCLENWVGEIEQRIGERESEWQAEQDGLRERLDTVSEERDQLQRQLHAAAKRYGNGSAESAVPDETLEKLQRQNAELQSTLEASQKQAAGLTRQVERLQTEEPESLQAERAEVAQEKAAASRLRFQLSKQLQDIEATPEVKDQPDREFAYKLQTLREHLREIHEEEKTEREQKGESLLGRISNLWKRVDDEF